MECEQTKLFQNNRIVLMSLRSIYFEQMLNGKKHYEYRKRYTKEESIAFIYLSRKEKKVCGIIEFGKPIVGNASKIAKLEETDQQSSYDSIKEYAGDFEVYAIPIKKITLTEEVTLSDIKNKFPNFVVPQSYYYLDKKPDLLKFLKEKMNIKYE